ncbi:heavy-metal-associated domain-containing protein [Streptosporangium carneum]|uniref:HMA domain-containing protein n=1 Tax=Streptosporangium carneum TaxID=47481 RepID=A0A9W6ICI8_9ACTN|nr:heavy-metal-associated domain-containing protein [Streptosporangium carneum]GLK15079.1 hypothetical protein GCM10017600_84920 [Streptosporangium carneum]
MCTACACGTEGGVSAQAGAGDTNVYTVNGMTCGHCVSSVSAEIGKVDGVTGVSVDLATGAATVSGAGVSHDEIRAAVGRAGYTLADASPVTAS